MADVCARAVHTGIHILRVHALSIGTSPHGQGLAAFTKDIPISTFGLFMVDLSKAVANVASASCNYQALADSFMLSVCQGLRRSLPPFHDKGQSQNGQSHSSSSTRRKRGVHQMEGCQSPD